jgi:hypothetical protein
MQSDQNYFTDLQEDFSIVRYGTYIPPLPTQGIIINNIIIIHFRPFTILFDIS